MSIFGIGISQMIGNLNECVRVFAYVRVDIVYRCSTSKGAIQGSSCLGASGRDALP